MIIHDHLHLIPQPAPCHLGSRRGCLLLWSPSFPFTFLSLHYTPQHALCFGSSSASRFGGAACHRGAAQAAAPGPRRQRAPGGAADYSASRCRGQNGTTGA